ncbi:MAG: glycoside hydrolase family 3 protein [Clostridia bacterium]|nr:glycoside hydrolase family 3 protein [Clostridia bacterium]
MNIINRIKSKLSGSVAQETGLMSDGDRELFEGLKEKARSLAEEGVVILKNEDGILPFNEKTRVAVFGRVQFDYFCVGYGSGGDVNMPYKVSFAQAIDEDNLNFDKKLFYYYKNECESKPIPAAFAWGTWPLSYEEFDIPENIIETASKSNEIAIVLFGRAAGEDRDNELKKGSYLLSDREEKLLKNVSKYFKKTVVVFNYGNPMDFSAADYNENIKAAVFAPHAGMDGGRVLRDALWGRFNPSGHLTDTVPLKYEFLPSANDFGDDKANCYTEDIYVGYRYFETFRKNEVLYPFGHGLSYTEFEAVYSANKTGKDITVKVKVKNKGEIAGKYVAQIYFEAPQGELGKPSRQLIAFEKTKLIEPGEETELKIGFSTDEMASFDDVGLTGNKACFVLESGEYRIFGGDSVRNAEYFFSFRLSKTEIVKQCENACAVVDEFNIIKPVVINGNMNYIPAKSGMSGVNLKERILERMPEEIPFTDDIGIKLEDVKSGKNSLDEFVAQLTVDELDVLCRGDVKMDSPFGAKGNAGAFGGTTESLRKKGVPAAITTDGPSGIRLAANATLMPSGVSIAASWNCPLTKDVFKDVAGEMKMKGSDILLGPGVNIHRNPLCGRNFEYFSEDPVISGKMGCAFIEGIQSQGVSACPKHFACNNQEKSRTKSDSRLTERALREIYLKPFEMCVKDAKANVIMTSYNMINSIHSHYNYDLCTTILRKDWGYDSVVITDWWMQEKKDPDFENNFISGYRVRAQADVLMPGSHFINRLKADETAKKSYKKGGLTRAELQRSAKNVLGFLIKNKMN